MFCVGLVFLIPALNEEKGIGITIREIKALKLKARICVADCYSKDKTAAVARKLGAEVYQNRWPGKGDCLREVMHVFPKDGDTVIITDADGTYSMKRVQQMLKLVNDRTMVAGSRFKGKLRGMPKFNELGNRVQSFLVSLLYGAWVTDINTGLRVYTARSFHKLKINSSGFDLEAEWTCKALKRGMQIIELPCDYVERKGATHLSPLRDGWRIIKRILKERVIS